MDDSISLNKFISDTGYCSRREADNLIAQGRVILNGQTAVLGNRYTPGDIVEVDGSYVTTTNKDKRVYLALNKPIGITTTTEQHIKDNIISFVNYPKRIFPIGRLDKDSEGLILLTNDGDIINKILRATNHHEKEYVVRVNKPIDNRFLQQMSHGVPILETRTLPCKVQMIGRQTFRIILTQGLNRQIRRMCEYLGYEVVALQRVRIMHIKLDKLAVGKWRYLSDAELSMLMDSLSESNKENTESRSAQKRRKIPEASFRNKKKSEEGQSQHRNSSERSSSSDPSHGKKSATPGGNHHTKASDKNKHKPSTKKQGDKPNRESKKGNRHGAEGSFKNYRSKGRR